MQKQSPKIDGKESRGQLELAFAGNWQLEIVLIRLIQMSFNATKCRGFLYPMFHSDSISLSVLKICLLKMDLE